MRWDVAGIGNALMDALVVLQDDSLVDDLGLVRGTMHLVDHARWTEVYERVQQSGVVFDSGGSCANTIATVGRLGGRAIYSGQVGDDQMGLLYASMMERACGSHRLRFTKVAATGKCLSIISARDAERTMLTDLGAATRLPDLGPFADELRQSRVAHFEGYTLLEGPNRQVTMEGLTIAEGAGAVVSLDASDPFVVAQIRDLFWNLLQQHVDVVFLNIEEARALADLEDPEAAARRIAHHGELGIVAVKLGARGSLVVHEGEVYRIPVYPVKAIDTTGAGDAYAGGFLYALSQGWSPVRAGRLASSVAAMAVGQVGAVVKDASALERAVSGVAET
ncbi:MAG: adenosine kinase [Myxococcota bacterium]